MSSLRPTTFLTAAACVSGLALSLAACGTSVTTSSHPIGTHTSYPHASPTPTASPVGSQCSMIPGHGSDSLSAMSTEEAVQAAASNPQLSVFTGAIRTTGLDATLNARHAFTLIIPENSSFAALSKTDIIHLHNSGDLDKIVRYHAVNARIMPSQFAKGASYATMEGSSLKLSKSGSTYKVNGATVLCGNIHTSNGTVYIINKVLLPPGT
jgi:uncharacterized surface protein with fasciclin (FAS1) repeats